MNLFRKGVTRVEGESSPEINPVASESPRAREQSPIGTVASEMKSAGVAKS